MNGPLLIAANHPNSFLDAVVLATVFNKPVCSLARGDAFASPFYTKVLLSLNMLPVYRISEGVENLESNYNTFEACKAIFRKNGIVLIFSEGRCINEWKLRPLKKGTARLALSAWQEGIPLKVLPCGINYQSFRRFGKNIQLGFGKIIENDGAIETEGKQIASFNNSLREELEKLVVTIDPPDPVRLRAQFKVQIAVWKKLLLFIPALAGWLIHAPLYYLVRTVTAIKTKMNDHYDSVIVGTLFITYPVYVLLIVILSAIFFAGWYALSLILILPLLAWCTVQLKPQF